MTDDDDGIKPQIKAHVLSENLSSVQRVFFFFVFLCTPRFQVYVLFYVPSFIWIYTVLKKEVNGMIMETDEDSEILNNMVFR